MFPDQKVQLNSTYFTPLLALIGSAKSVINSAISLQVLTNRPIQSITEQHHQITQQIGI